MNFGWEEIPPLGNSQAAQARRELHLCQCDPLGWNRVNDVGRTGPSSSSKLREECCQEEPAMVKGGYKAKGDQSHDEMIL